VQFDTGFVIHCVFDDSQKTLVGTLADGDGFTDELVATERSPRRRHGTWVAVCTSIQGRVDATKIRALSLGASTLCRHGDDVVAPYHEDTLILHQFAIPDEENTTVNVKDLALSTFATILLDVVFLPDLRPIAIGRYSVLVTADNLRYLGMKECANVAFLIDYT
jgi:hypothetical protein